MATRASGSDAMFKPVLLLTALWVFAGCTTYGPKQAVEHGANERIGRVFSEAFREYRVTIRCGNEGGDEGCLVIDARDCEIWYAIHKDSGRITGWRYAGRPEKCWTFQGR